MLGVVEPDIEILEEIVKDSECCHNPLDWSYKLIVNEKSKLADGLDGVELTDIVVKASADIVKSELESEIISVDES